MSNFLDRFLKLNRRKHEETDFEYLSRAWSARHGKLQQNFHRKHGKALKWLRENVSPEQLALGSIGGLMLLAIPGIGNFIPPSPVEASGLVTNKSSRKMVFLAAILEKLPKAFGLLSPDEERAITDILSRAYGFKVTAEMGGKRMNTNYGLIGAEQHLYRFPGDNLGKHFETDKDRKLYERFGIAPGLGAWRYFSSSTATFTDKDNFREKYYVVTQTFLAPGFSTNVREYGDFFKYRKILVFNPKNGEAVVGDIGDSGPAPWTGKQFGGSPEVMHSLNLDSGPQKGPVLFFFIDDPEDKISLGPVEMI